MVEKKDKKAAPKKKTRKPSNRMSDGMKESIFHYKMHLKFGTLLVYKSVRHSRATALKRVDIKSDGENSNKTMTPKRR